MKVNELFESNYGKMSVNSIIDSEIQRQAGMNKKGMDSDARNTRTATRGFRVGFARDSWDGAEGLNDADIKIFNAAKKAGEKAKKNHKGEIPPIQLSNNYGERRPNPAFNKVIKPYLDAFHAAPVNESMSDLKSEIMGKTKPQVSKLMAKAGYSRVKIPGGEASHEASYMSNDIGGGHYHCTFSDGKLISAKKGR